jgi:hypothetical protein
MSCAYMRALVAVTRKAQQQPTSGCYWTVIELAFDIIVQFVPVDGGGGSDETGALVVVVLLSNPLLV